MIYESCNQIILWRLSKEVEFALSRRALHFFLFLAHVNSIILSLIVKKRLADRASKAEELRKHAMYAFGLISWSREKKRKNEVAVGMP
jgi:hypothetical protein